MQRRVFLKGAGIGLASLFIPASVNGKMLASEKTRQKPNILWLKKN